MANYYHGINMDRLSSKLRARVKLMDAEERATFRTLLETLGEKILEEGVKEVEESDRTAEVRRIYSEPHISNDFRYLEVIVQLSTLNEKLDVLLEKFCKED